MSVAPAGDFSTWIEVTLRSGDSPEAAEVPCGDCTACCTSSYFIHIRPDETEALARIPIEYLVEAPGLPSGHVVMGYDERGHCPMLVDGGCSIYDDRPQTCRDYDCRIFAATGLEPTDKMMVVEQTRRWVFDTPTELARVQQEAVRTCADYLQAHAHHLPPGAVPKNPTHLAILAVTLHELFVDGEPGAERVIVPDIDVVSDALTESMRQIRMAPKQ
jgi:Fe-S-cluster containining protein